MTAQAIRFELDRRTIRLFKRFSRGDDTIKRQLYQQILKLFDRRATIVASNISENFLTGQRLNVRSGQLRRSITGKGELVRGLPALRVGVFRGPSVAYAGVHELGTKGFNPDSPFPTIVPRNAKALAFPVPDGPAVTPTGQPRFGSGGPREFPNDLKFVPFRESGIAIGGLFDLKSYEVETRRSRQDGRDFSLRNVVTVYLLLRKLDLPPQFFLRDGLIAELPSISRELSELLAEFAAGQEV